MRGVTGWAVMPPLFLETTGPRPSDPAARQPPDPCHRRKSPDGTGIFIATASPDVCSIRVHGKRRGAGYSLPFKRGTTSMTKSRKTVYAFAAVAALASISTQCSAEANEHGPRAENVKIVNTPLPTRDVDNPASQPVQVEAGQAIGQFTGQAVLFTVPAGKRLVVEHFSSEMGIATGTAVDRYLLSIADNPAQPGNR